jgi:hypothetical protein
VGGEGRIDIEAPPVHGAGLPCRHAWVFRVSAVAIDG